MDHQPEYSPCEVEGVGRMINRIEAALNFIGADDRDTWLRCAMGIKAELGEDGFAIWDRWSQQSDAYKASAAKAVWKSCRGVGVSIGSVFHEAKANGWRDDDKYQKPTAAQIEARCIAQAERNTEAAKALALSQQNAAKKAAWILHQAKTEKHAYLHSKGWMDAVGPVWWPDEANNLLCIPMRVGAHLVGVQLIDREGVKKFLTGQRTSGAEHVISNDGPGAQDWFVEGYASGLSLRECLKALRLRYRIRICFSAHNLMTMAKASGRSFVVADHDASGAGEKAAIGAGLPYYMPPELGQDINDLHKLHGTFKTSQILRKWLADVKK